MVQMVLFVGHEVVWNGGRADGKKCTKDSHRFTTTATSNFDIPFVVLVHDRSAAPHVFSI